MLPGWPRLNPTLVGSFLNTGRGSASRLSYCYPLLCFLSLSFSFGFVFSFSHRYPFPFAALIIRSCLFCSYFGTYYGLCTFLLGPYYLIVFDLFVGFALMMISVVLYV